MSHMQRIMEAAYIKDYPLLQKRHEALQAAADALAKVLVHADTKLSFFLPPSDPSREEIRSAMAAYAKLKGEKE